VAVTITASPQLDPNERRTQIRRALTFRDVAGDYGLTVPEVEAIRHGA